MPLFLASGYLQVWCMCYFYNRETIQLFKTLKAAETNDQTQKGKKLQRRGGGKPDSALLMFNPEPQLTAATKYLARFSSLQFSPLVQHACPERRQPCPGMSKEGRVKKKLNHDSIRRRNNALSATNQQKQSEKSRPRLCPEQIPASISFAPKLTFWKIPPLDDFTQVYFILYFLVLFSFFLVLHQYVLQYFHSEGAWKFLIISQPC